MRGRPRLATLHQLPELAHADDSALVEGPDEGDTGRAGCLSGLGRYVRQPVWAFAQPAESVDRLGASYFAAAPSLVKCGHLILHILPDCPTRPMSSSCLRMLWVFEEAMSASVAMAEHR